ncbi:MAG: hypothetical protein LRY68_12365, partial [Sulfurospirillum sp.]|nr:hypothetical protein [Sulfurospirillum sp.]
NRVFGFQNIFQQGISNEASPSLWIMIPILTLLGITFIRVSFGLDHHFDQKMANASMFTFTSLVLSLQLIFGLIGYKVMRNIGYFETFVHSNTLSPTSFALICPGVAFYGFWYVFYPYRSSSKSGFNTKFAFLFSHNGAFCIHSI